MQTPQDNCEKPALELPARQTLLRALGSKGAQPAAFAFRLHPALDFQQPLAQGGLLDLAVVHLGDCGRYQDVFRGCVPWSVPHTVLFDCSLVLYRCCARQCTDLALPDPVPIRS